MNSCKIPALWKKYPSLFPLHLFVLRYYNQNCVYIIITNDVGSTTLTFFVLVDLLYIIHGEWWRLMFMTNLIMHLFFLFLKSTSDWIMIEWTNYRRVWYLYDVMVEVCAPIYPRWPPLLDNGLHHKNISRYTRDKTQKTNGLSGDL